MTQIFTPGQTVYLLFWRRPEERHFTRVQIFVSKHRRNLSNGDLLSWGLITLSAEWEIPSLNYPKPEQVKVTPNCPTCGATMVCLYHGKGTEQWVCPCNCDSRLDEVLRKANEKARQVLGDDELSV